MQSPLFKTLFNLGKFDVQYDIWPTSVPDDFPEILVLDHQRFFVPQNIFKTFRQRVYFSSVSEKRSPSSTNLQFVPIILGILAMSQKENTGMEVNPCDFVRSSGTEQKHFVMSVYPSHLNIQPQTVKNRVRVLVKRDIPVGLLKMFFDILTGEIESTGLYRTNYLLVASIENQIGT